MTLKEFYAEADGDYEDVLAGLGKKERVLKYLKKIPETDVAGKIRAALDAEDYETAFRESHNLKGMCLNISLNKLGKLSVELTESLRHGPTEDVEALFTAMNEEYERVCGLVAQI